MRVEIWSDINCPWCYIGKRRFETALAEFEHADEVEVLWRSFELDPEAPAELHGDRAARIAAKYSVSVEQAREMESHLTGLAAAEGLAYDFANARTANSFDGHRMIHLAAEHGLQDAMKERLLRAYLCEGELISDPDTLVRLAVEVGVPRAAALATLDSDWFKQAVRDDERAAHELGVSGVPTFIVERQIGVSGAQPPELLLAMLTQAWERLAAPQALPPA